MFYFDSHNPAESVTDKPEDVCHQICMDVNCQFFSTMERFNQETMKNEQGCTIDFFGHHFIETPSYLVTEEPGLTCYVRGSPVDCTETSNCTPQREACGGTLPNFNLSKPDLLSCIPNATSFDFESKIFVRKKHKINDFFYNEADKSFMNGRLLEFSSKQKPKSASNSYYDVDYKSWKIGGGSSGIRDADCNTLPICQQE